MEERIKYLFRKFLDNTCTKEEFEEVFSYIRMAEKDPVIQAFFDKVYESEFEEQPSMAFVDVEGHLKGLSGPAVETASFGKKLQGMMQRWPAAVTVVIVLGVLAWVWNDDMRKPEMAAAAVNIQVTKSTERSEYRYLLLPDSTEVWLNAESTLEFPQKFTGSKREVVLKGEAFFDVKHANKIPFVIYTGEVSTEVLGTAFNIKAYPDMEKITVSVKRGKVKVNYAKKQVALLTVGQQVSITPKAKLVNETQVKETETSAWQEGKLIYDDYMIGDILLDLERVYNQKVKVDVGGVETLRVSTSFKRDQGIEKALEVLCRLTDTELEREDGIYHIR
ncbi:MAG: FecR domain-containing protein [Chitinophagaceae bacterium]|nr:FecR domain-containing protein [Chitinophagaceae bacterium]